MKKRRRIGRICWHKGTSRWYCTIDGHSHYLSGRCKRTRQPPQAVRAAYDDIMGQHLQDRARPAPAPVSGLDIIELWNAYRIYCEQRYRKYGKPTSEVQDTKAACKVVAQLFGDLPAAEFGVAELRQVREEFLRPPADPDEKKTPWSPGHCNQQISRVRRMFAWGAEQGLVPESVWVGLGALKGLPRPPEAKERHQRRDVPDELIEATLPRLPQSLQLLVRVHRLIGCRAHEVCCMRTCDLDLDADQDEVDPALRCWLYRPSESKTNEQYWVGPRAQEILRPLLRPDAPHEYLFPTRRKAGGQGHWTTSTYARAVTHACKGGRRRVSGSRAKVPEYIDLDPLPLWTPLMIRRRAAEEARQKHPARIEATQARLRHAKVDVSQVYAQDRDTLGRDVARRLG